MTVLSGLVLSLHSRAPNAHSSRYMSGSQDANMKSFQEINDSIREIDGSLKLQISDLQESIRVSHGSQQNMTALAALEDLRESVSAATLAIKSASSNHYFDIPQSVSSIFTGRETLLKELRQIFVPARGIIRDHHQQRFVIYGLGGSGKTQFCCKFAQDNRDR